MVSKAHVLALRRLQGDVWYTLERSDAAALQTKAQSQRRFPIDDQFVRKDCEGDLILGPWRRTQDAPQ